MDLRKLTPRYYVSPQICAEDMPALTAAGITRILCNRPDEEVPASHCADAIRDAALAAGIVFVNQPLTHQTMVPDVIANNRAIGAETDDVVLAYCASGTRSCIAWALGQAGTLDADEIIAAGHAGGYELAQMRQVLTQAFE